MAWTGGDRAGGADSTVVLAELNVRHTRRHQPYRRVALDPGYLPTNGNAYGAVLLGAVISEFVGGLDEEQQELLPRFVRDARKGDLDVPRIALRYRLQTDIHGLDRSRHRFLAEPGRVVIEIDVHVKAGEEETTDLFFMWNDASGGGLKPPDGKMTTETQRAQR